MLNSLERGIAPKEVLSFKHQKIEFDNWEKLVQLDFMRETLNEGLQLHFEKNDLLQEIFDVGHLKDAKKTQLSQTEKRLYFSPSSVYSKARTKDINKQRSSREHATQTFLEE